MGGGGGVCQNSMGVFCGTNIDYKGKYSHRETYTRIWLLLTLLFSPFLEYLGGGGGGDGRSYIY